MSNTTLYTDLLKAQKEIESVDKDAKNPFFKSDYTTLNATIEACKKVLNDNNIIVLQPIESDENGVYVCTTLIHTSGEKITSKMHIREAKSNDPQAQGSAITYARRYSLKSILCMSDADDDGEKAMDRPAPQPARKPVDPRTAKYDKPLCPYHKVEMFKAGKMKDFAHKDDKHGWCNGGGYAHEKADHRKNIVASQTEVYNA